MLLRALRLGTRGSTWRSPQGKRSFAMASTMANNTGSTVVDGKPVLRGVVFGRYSRARLTERRVGYACTSRQARGQATPPPPHAYAAALPNQESLKACLRLAPTPLHLKLQLRISSIRMHPRDACLTHLSLAAVPTPGPIIASHSHRMWTGPDRVTLCQTLMLLQLTVPKPRHQPRAHHRSGLPPTS